MPLQSCPQCLATQSPCRRTHSAWRGRLAGGASRLHTLKLTLAGQWQHFLPPRRYSLILPRLTGVFFLSLSPSLLACVLWLLSCPRRQILRYFHFYVWVSIFHSCGKNSCYFLPSFSFQLLVLCWFASIKKVDFFFFLSDAYLIDRQSLFKFLFLSTSTLSVERDCHVWVWRLPVASLAFLWSYVVISKYIFLCLSSTEYLYLTFYFCCP